MDNGLDIKEFLKLLEKDFDKEMETIPNEMLKGLLDRSYKDAKKLFSQQENKIFKSITYAIYRSYILGMLIERISNKTNDEEKKVIHIIDFQAN